jgi:hypothetical protein
MRHAQLDVAEGGAWLSDLRSTNGTFVEGRPLSAPVWLASESEFRVGRTTVRFAADQPKVPSRPRSTGPTVEADPTPPIGGPAAPTHRGYIRDAGPVAGGDVSMRGGRDVAGRDIVIHEGFKLKTRMRSSAKNCIRLGCLLFLGGFGLFGYFVITWNNQIFDAVTNSLEGPPSDLPSPIPWLPVGAVLMFAGLVLVVTGLLIPRDRVVIGRGA